MDSLTINPPYISALVPVHNASSCLAKCIDSILNQTFGDFELILFDDGSDDSSWSLMEQYKGKDSRIKLYRHEVKKGTLTARNSLLRHAVGEYVTFIDADDYVSTDFFMEIHANTKDEKFDMVEFSGEIVYSAKTHNCDKVLSFKRECKEKKLYGDDVFNQLFFDNDFYWPLHRKAFLRKFAESHLPDDIYLVYSEDRLEIMYWLCYARSYLFKNIKVYYYCYGEGGWGRKLYTPEEYALRLHDSGIAVDLMRKLLLRAKPDPVFLERLDEINSQIQRITLSYITQKRFREEDMNQALEIYIKYCGIKELAAFISGSRFMDVETPIKAACRTFFWFTGIVIKRWYKRIKDLLSS